MGGVSEAQPRGENRNPCAINRRAHLEPISESTLSRPESAGRSTSPNRTYQDLSAKRNVRFAESVPSP